MANWIRFYNLDMVCPLCQHNDACSISEDGKTICCSRVKSDTLIGKPFAGGFLHPAKTDYNINKTLLRKEKQSSLQKNFQVLQDFYSKNLLQNSESGVKLAKEWDVPFNMLLSLGLGLSDKSLTIPMYDDFLNIVGIQRRYQDGSKKYIKGSNLGIFIGWPINSWPRCVEKVVVCEGYSDMVTASCYGALAVGRPSCGTGIDTTIKVLSLLGTKEAVVISDNGNDAERWGAELTHKTLEENGFKSKLIIPPCKDLRLWRKEGLTKEKFNSII
jgi:hypothetical protein